MDAEAVTLRLRKDTAASVALLPAALVLGWLSFRPGLAAFAVAATGTVALLRYACRAGERPGPGTTLALIIYSALLAVAAVTVREAMGLNAPQALPGSTAIGGNEMRLMAGEFALFFVLYSATVLEFIRASGAHLGLKRPSPATAIFAFVLYFAVVKLPPYELDIREWGALLASASAVTEGRWPYFHHYSVQHGFLNAGALTLWLKAFGPTPIGLASFVSALAALSGVVAFLLVKRLTNSRGAALIAALVLVTNFHYMEAAVRAPGLGALQSQFQIIAGLYLLWAALEAGASARGYLHAFLFGALSLWEPAFGFFMALSFLSVTVYRAVSRRDQRLFYHVAALIAGVLLPVSTLAAFRPPEVNIFSGTAMGIFLSTQQVFTQGQGAAPRTFFFWEVFILIFFAGLFMTAYRQVSSGRSFSRRHLFLFGTALMLPPWLAYRLGSPVPLELSPIAWLLAPALALIFHTAYRHAAIGTGRPRLYAAAVITASPLLSIDLARPIGEDINRYLVKYEDERARWQASCADEMKRGGYCGPEKGSGLSFHMKAARETGLGLGAYGPAGFSYYPPNFFLARACEKGVPVISDMDGAIAVQNGCPPPHRFPVMRNMDDNAVLAGYLGEIKRFSRVVFDERLADGLSSQGLLRRLKRELLDSGYHVSERHGVISVLSREGAIDGDSCIVCAPPAEPVRLAPDGGWLVEKPSGLKRKPLDAPSWGSFVFSALVWADGPAGLVVGETGGGYAAFYIDPASGTARLSELKGAEIIRELSKAELREKSKGKGSWHDMEVFGGRGGHYQFFVDGEFVLEKDGLKGAAIGLLDLSGTARFREVELARGPETGGA
ncbi:MAG: hypothetical protein H3C68_07090 [Deltaproteobacteria bacterium]|nr:hypothetical protein [Deltaproteobacteria bacterium]MBZ0219480.1 hypothetical protein [Deltaproteobacteria bacterium]